MKEWKEWDSKREEEKGNEIKQGSVFEKEESI